LSTGVPDIERVGRPERPTRSSRGGSVGELLLVRFAFALPVVLGVITLIFLVGAFSKYDPGRSVLGLEADPRAIHAWDQAHGYNDALPVQWARYLSRLAHGNLGVTLATQEPIGDRLKRAIPVTVSLTLIASGFALLFGVVCGILAAIRRNSLADRAVLVGASVGHAIPAFWSGLLIIEVFAVHWHVIPSGGYTPISGGVGAWFKSLIGPALALAIPFGAVMARVIRSSFVEEFDKDYVRTAEGLGLTTATIVARNVLRNAVTAPITSFGVGVGVLFSGAVLIESLFQLPGLGSMLVDGIRTGDFALVAAVGIFGGAAFVVVNAIVDVICIVLNPRENSASKA
jgi:peptide/nickel transport system permease protein